MNQYSVHFIDRKNYVFACEELLSFTDADAIVAIGERPVPRYCGAFEIWRHESLIFRGPVGHRDRPLDEGDVAFQYAPSVSAWVASMAAS